MKNEKNYIRIKGANEHNLKNLDINIPRDEFVVLTGLSGSGKSSLAFDTIYACFRSIQLNSCVISESGYCS